MAQKNGFINQQMIVMSQRVEQCNEMEDNSAWTIATLIEANNDLSAEKAEADKKFSDMNNRMDAIMKMMLQQAEINEKIKNEIVAVKDTAAKDKNTLQGEVDTLREVINKQGQKIDRLYSV